VPSVRVNVVSMVAAALPPAVGAPVLVNGGQVVAQALVQADLVLVSSSNAYNADRTRRPGTPRPVRS
jgi:hypothetical protein